MLRVRYHPTDLADEGTVEILEADSFEIMDDHTVVLMRENDEGEDEIVGFIHSSRWDSIIREDETVGKKKKKD